MKPVLFLHLLLGLGLMASNAWAGPGWPQIPLPKNATLFSVGEKLVLNGMPMHLSGFTSAASADQMAEWFRQALGQPLVENRIGKTLVLGKASGEYYLTVQLETAGGSTRGVAAVTHLKGAHDRRQETGAMADRWLQRLPSGSRIVSQLSSDDRGRHSQHLIIINEQSEQANAERLTDLLKADGLALERESRVIDAPHSPERDRLGDGRALFYKGTVSEGMATVARNPQGQTVVVVNTISSPGVSK